MAKSEWNAWIWIKWKAGAPTSAWEKWQKKDSIKSAWSTQGEWDCCLWVEAHDQDQLEEIVWKEIRSNEWVAWTQTTWAKKWW